jgi:hypothetical protein
MPLDMAFGHTYTLLQLYCAGNTVDNRFAVGYPTMSPGLTHGMAYVTGRLAGSYATAEKV